MRKAAQARGVSADIVTRWGTAFGWVARVAAWDREQDRLKRDAMLKAAEKMGTRQANQAVLLQGAVMLPVQEFLRRVNQRRADGKDPFEGFSDQQLMRAVETASRAFAQVATFERLARGMTTSNDHVSVTTTSLDVRVAEARQRAENMGRSELEAFLLGADTQRDVEQRAQASDAGSRPRNTVATERRDREILG